MCPITTRRLRWIVYFLFINGRIISGDSLALNTVFQDLCSRSLSNLIFQICTGGIPVSDLPSSSLSRVRSRRAAMFFAKERHRRQIADECCLHPCTVAQLVEYCPENW